MRRFCDIEMQVKGNRENPTTSLAGRQVH
jgi:hypothetical protein